MYVIFMQILLYLPWRALVTDVICTSSAPESSARRQRRAWNCDATFSPSSDNRHQCGGWTCAPGRGGVHWHNSGPRRSCDRKGQSQDRRIIPGWRRCTRRGRTLTCTGYDASLAQQTLNSRWLFLVVCVSGSDAYLNCKRALADLVRRC